MYGLLLFLPTILISVLAISFVQLGLLSLILPLLTVAAATFFLPFGFGNGYVARLAESLRPEDRDALLVQVAFVPRLRLGLRGVMEDADDIGWLSCTEKDLAFRGDSVNVSIPLTQVRTVRRENSGFRGLFLYSRTAIKVEGVDDFDGLRFAERSSLVLPTSWRAARQLYKYLSSKVPESQRRV
ncbi:MAG TPA: hypothetical protein VJA21_14290 [Verrucomicrobiae bacterium]